MSFGKSREGSLPVLEEKQEIRGNLYKVRGCFSIAILIASFISDFDCGANIMFSDGLTAKTEPNRDLNIFSGSFPLVGRLHYVTSGHFPPINHYFSARCLGKFMPTRAYQQVHPAK